MFISSRNEAIKVDFKKALFSPLSPDGGLYCPSEIKPFNNVDELIGKSFNEVALKVLEQLGLGLYKEEFASSLKAYDEFDEAKPLAIKSVANRHIIELWHGKSRAFKDLALAPLAKLMHLLSDEKLLICCATSGDTGPATLSAFNHLAKLVCIYPEGKTSALQRAQMIKQHYEDALVLGIDGNFDDAQTALKQLLNDEEFKSFLASKNICLGAANSLNFGRILYQCVYHFYVAINAKSNYEIVVPSGNFGNALGAFYAKILGADIKKIKIISNENCVLKDFFTTGVYDLRNREFKCTKSPAMDILRSSNLERLIYYFFKAERCKECFLQLDEQGYFALNAQELSRLQNIFTTEACSDEECLKTIATIYANSSYLLDPHTACAFAKSQENDYIASTAEWVKFAPSIAMALGDEMLDEALYIQPHHPQLSALIKSEQNYGQLCKVDEIKGRIKLWLS